MKKYLPFLLLLFLLTGYFGNKLIKTDTLANRKVNLTYLLKNTEVKTKGKSYFNFEWLQLCYQKKKIDCKSEHDYY